MDDSGVIYAYLLGVEANRVVFATNSLYVADGPTPATELRIASPMQYEALNKTLYTIDRKAKRIESWRAVYEWLGRDVRPGGITGWATFEKSFANDELPHWFGDGCRVECLRPNVAESTGIERAFRAKSLPHDWVSRYHQPLQMMLGDIDEREDLSHASHCLTQMVSNMLISEQPVHSNFRQV